VVVVVVVVVWQQARQSLQRWGEPVVDVDVVVVVLQDVQEVSPQWSS